MENVLISNLASELGIADCGLCSGVVLNSHEVVHYMWIHDECPHITETQYETLQNSNCTWICPKFVLFNFSDSS